MQIFSRIQLKPSLSAFLSVILQTALRDQSVLVDNLNLLLDDDSHVNYYIIEQHQSDHFQEITGQLLSICMQEELIENNQVSLAERKTNQV